MFDEQLILRRLSDEQLEGKLNGGQLTTVSALVMRKSIRRNNSRGAVRACSTGSWGVSSAVSRTGFVRRERSDNEEAKQVLTKEKQLSWRGGHVC